MDSLVKKIVSAVFVWSLLIFSPFAAAALAAEPVGTAGSVRPSFWVVRGGNRVDLVDGGEIYEFDILETDQTGYAIVTFVDQSVLEIAGGSRIDVRSVVFSPDRKRFNVGVMQGAARIITGEIVRRNPKNFKLTTPKSTIGIRGTTLLVEVSASYEKFTVEAIGEGHVVNYSSKSGRDSWTMTRPGDTVSVRVSAPAAPVAPTAPTLSPVSPVSPIAPTPPAVSPAVSVSVEAEGEGVVRGERDTQGVDKSGGGDNPKADPQGASGNSGRENDDSGGEDDDDDDESSGGGRNPGDDCCNDNSSPGLK
ncbi:MAG: FecR family protein [Synergistaceae bacterium]|jgi:hypothetical protein|nr:FecR family protein [Synergistaceae bacterium]